MLIVSVTERPAIAKIDITGNKSIETDQLTSLKDIGLAGGRVLNRFVLDQIEQELGRLFFNLGKYGVEVKPRSRRWSETERYAYRLMSGGDYG